jgi:sarcosine oxidase
MAGTTSDVIVVGLGAMGAATLYQLAKRGIKALGIDRYHPPHVNGSTHGDSRITRIGVGEGADYVRFARRSHEIWHELEALTGERLFTPCGLAVIAPMHNAPVHHGQAEFLGQSIEYATAFDVPHEVLDGDEYMRRFPQFMLNNGESVYYEPGAGFVVPEKCVAVQLAEAERHGAQMRLGETVLSWTQHAGGVSVTTDKATYHAGQVVLSAGAWVQQLVETPLPLKVYPQVLHWFALEDPEMYVPSRCPVYIWMYGPGADDYLYGFPAMPGASEIKIATEQYRSEWDGKPLNPLPDPGLAQKHMFEHHVRSHFRGVLPQATRSMGCLYTVTPNARFIIDQVPGADRVFLVSACSGHGFKHSAGIGDAIAAEIVAAGTGLPNRAAFALAQFSS